MKTIRVAIIGVTQPHGQGYIDTLRLLPGVEIVGGYDLDESTRTKAATALGDDAPIYDDIDALLDNDPARRGRYHRSAGHDSGHRDSRRASAASTW